MRTRLLGLPPHVIDEALNAVNLLPVRHRLVRQYSTGMKQRLGIATALLGDPDLLVLDEMTNGFDSAGIHEVRELVRVWADRKTSQLVTGLDAQGRAIL